MSLSEKPLVSVVIPSHNRATLVMESINSVLNQTYSNLELILVDDCSSDNTKDVVRNITDPRFHYVCLERQSGACAARNKGIELAKGELIAFNDSDDHWAPEKLASQIEFLRTTEADVVICRMNCYYTDGTFSHSFPLISTQKQLSYKDLLIYNSASTQLIMGRAECFRTVRFDPDMPRMQDWDIILRLSLRYSIFYQNVVLVNTYLQKDSISSHPEKGLCAMRKLFAKHSKTILSSPVIAESFLKKAASFSCKSGYNPVASMDFLSKASPSLFHFLRYLLACAGLYLPCFNFKHSFLTKNASSFPVLGSLVEKIRWRRTESALTARR